jgi:putative endonuclease
MTTQRSGSEAEDLAAAHLEAQGLSIVARNFRCRMGEIDLIAREGEVLVFVEVRLRRNKAFGGAAASIDHAKQHKLVATAQFYLAGRKTQPRCRFDAILLDGLDARRIEWLRDVISA